MGRIDRVYPSYRGEPMGRVVSNLSKVISSKLQGDFSGIQRVIRVNP